MNTSVKALFTHFFTLVFFVLVALAFFHPVLQGKTILQSDIQQYNGMSREQTEFRKTAAEEPYWTNSAFGGMPTYQLGARYPHHYVKDLDRIIRFLPRPADYLFLYFLGFYILLSCLKIDYKLAILGALAFGFSTYFIIILGVGHNAKAHALGYLPVLLAGILLVFRKKYIWGFLIASLGMALEVAANHYQMTYYFMLLVLVLGIVFLVEAIIKRTLGHYFKALGILLAAVLLGIGVNATSLLATKEYADWSTRGPSEISIQPDGSPRESTAGLDKEYITQYSYGIVESLNLFVPRLYGGASSENLGKKSKTYDYLTEQGLARSRALEFSSALPLYWGEQPGTAGPAYLGAVVFFLFILGLILVKGKYKWWLLIGSVMALLLSWGKNFSLLTDFMIDYFPLYDKFRAVSSIQVLIELCVPLLMVLGLYQFFSGAKNIQERLQALKLSFIVVFGLGIGLLLVQSLFSFTGSSDGTYERYFGEEVVAMIRRDREAVYLNDTIRSLIFVLLAALILWLYLKGKLKRVYGILLLVLLICVDLVGVAKRYVNEDQFVRQRVVKEAFQESAVDKQILADSSVYRVYDPAEGLNGARTSNFYQSIGGYHAAKPAGIQDLFDFHIYRNNASVIDMLNVKYVIQQDEEGRRSAGYNPNACGNAWFVSRLIEVENSDTELISLDSLDVQNEAVVNKEKFPDISRFQFEKDSLASIVLKDYKPNHLTYLYSTSTDGLVVFSEMYYASGWNAYVDGKAEPHFRVNYVLRAMEVPAGQHKIEFKFQPEVIDRGSKITMASSITLLIFLLGGILFTVLRNKGKKVEKDA
ncbi:MAG: YfhO family protein [Flavobacteriaceae bacterium]